MRKKSRYRRQKEREFWKAVCFLVVIAILLASGCFYIYHCFAKMYEELQEVGMTIETENVALDTEQTKEAVCRVFLDAGHGGKDVGTSVDEILEKDINLAVALKVGSILEENDIAVIFTRETDEKVSLNERVDMANLSGADLFVSLHCNYYEEDSRIAGLECYYHPDTEDCRGYAETIANAVLEVEGVVVRETKAEDYYVLRNTTMPAVLVEMGFLSNDTEAQRLASEEYQQLLAESIAEGIMESLQT